MNRFFSNVIFFDLPETDSINLISCDSFYWEKYGIYNAISCSETNHDIHVHIINPTDDSLNSLIKIKEKIKLTYSYEFFEVADLNFYFLKSYYYMSRFFVAQYIFNNTSVQQIKITDADIIFNENVIFSENIHLALSYRPDKGSLWEKSAAYFVYITKKYLDFLSEVIELYKEKLMKIDFQRIESIENKVERANFTGLDQVCLSEILERKKSFQCEDFLNLDKLSNFASKGEYDSKIWVLVGKTKNALDNNHFAIKYKKYFREEK